MVAIEVINDGHRAVVANAPQLKIAEDPDRVIALLGADGVSDFPKRLDQGDSGVVQIEYRDVAVALARKGFRGSVRLKATCTDSIGNSYDSEPWTISIREWLEMAA
jgi:hypothetical protein